MGKRGPRPTPTKTLKARGSWLAKSREKAGEIDPPEGIPDCPTWVPGDVREWWQELTQQLAAVHLLTKQDRLTLALLVDAIHQYLQLRGIVESEGYTSESVNGGICAHPAAAQMSKAWERVLKAAREFGLSPASRAGLHASPGDSKSKDGKSRFFGPRLAKEA